MVVVVVVAVAVVVAVVAEVSSTSAHDINRGTNTMHRRMGLRGDGSCSTVKLLRCCMAGTMSERNNRV